MQTYEIDFVFVLGMDLIPVEDKSFCCVISVFIFPEEFTSWKQAHEITTIKTTVQCTDYCHLISRIEQKLNQNEH